MPDETSTTEIALRVASTVEDLAILEPLWCALQAHHAEITPSLGKGTPKRSTADSWQMRRSKYERWLKDGRPSS